MIVYHYIEESETVLYRYLLQHTNSLSEKIPIMFILFILYTFTLYQKSEIESSSYELQY